MKQLTSRLTAILTAATVLAGCAAIRIDVDVYKGPLANHEDIQVRQYATLAIAAKPVLASVRNRIASGSDHANDKAIIGRLRDGEQGQHVPQGFEDETANFVNGAMSFYLDTAPPRVARTVDSAIRNHAVMRDAVIVLDNQPAKDDALGSDLLRRYPDGRYPGAAPAGAEAAREYHRWLFGNLQGNMLAGKSEAPAIAACEPVDSSGRLKAAGTGAMRIRSLETEAQCACDSFRRASRDDRLRCAVEPSSNAAYEIQEDRQAVSQQSRVLFGVENEAYVARMIEKAKAFRAAREALREMWLATADLVPLVAAGTQRQREAAALALAQTVQSRSFACYLTRGDVTIDAGLKHVLRGGPLLNTVRETAWGPEDYAKAELAIRDSATTFPLATARLLSDAHVWLAVAPVAQISACTALNADDRKLLEPKSARKYGIARGPTRIPEFSQAMQALPSLLIAISANSAGFDSARPAAGIETLSIEFQSALANSGNDVNNETVIRARRRLEETLIQWAERILVVVNNRAMLTTQRKQAGGEGLAREIAVIESVANTIILNADDIRRRDGHNRRLGERAAGELAGVRQAFTLSASQSYDLVLKEVQATIETMNRKHAAITAAPGATASDQLKTELEKNKTALGTLQTGLPDLRAAAVTLKGPFPGVMPLADEASAAADAAAIRKQVQGLAATSDLKAVLAATTTWLERESKGSDFSLVPGSPRAKRLERAGKFLNAPAQTAKMDALQAGVAAPTAAKLFGALADKLHAGAAQSIRLELGLAQNIDAIQKELTRRDGAATTLVQIEDGRLVLAALQKVRGDALNEADKIAPNDTTGLLAIVKRLLEKESAATTDAATKKMFDTAVKVVSSMTPSQALAITPPAVRRAPTQVDVTDDLLAVLRARRVEALASNNTATADGLQAAIKFLMEQRADMAYLRPASAYLKSAFASTALQASNDTNWVNMIARNTGRAFGIPAPSEYEKEYAATLGAIDKQFWQNINSVNLAGGGKTNYVLAKDDIGNWYVKAYSSDAGDIFKSAQGLALFGMGKRLDVNLLRRAQLQRQLDDKDVSEDAKTRISRELDTQTDKPSAAGSSALAGVAQRYQAQYESRTREDATLLLQGLRGLGAGIRGAWSSNLTVKGQPDTVMIAALVKYIPENGTLSQLDSSAAALVAAIDKTDGTPAERAGGQARALITGLESVRRVRSQVESGIRGDLALVQDYSNTVKDKQSREAEAKAKTEPTDPTEKAAWKKEIEDKGKEVTDAREAETTAGQNRTKAAELTVKMANELTASVARRRLDTIKQTETALTIVGQAAGGGP